MVLVDGVKYACNRCIRGHRVSGCNHTDQQLFMIKPKGRPSTHCSHCKNSRRTRNAHVKCTCGAESVSKPDNCKCSVTNRCVCTNKSKHARTKSFDPPATLPPRALNNGSQVDLSKLAGARRFEALPNDLTPSGKLGTGTPHKDESYFDGYFSLSAPGTHTAPQHRFHAGHASHGSEESIGLGDVSPASSGSGHHYPGGYFYANSAAGTPLTAPPLMTPNGLDNQNYDSSDLPPGEYTPATLGQLQSFTLHDYSATYPPPAQDPLTSLPNERRRSSLAALLPNNPRRHSQGPGQVPEPAPLTDGPHDVEYPPAQVMTGINYLY